ncbi:MAG: bifunctional nuclease family protein [Anaerolineae bacterium]|nr:bifunctional nuclease family protein [Candidatus Roseilinea sp.]MDW8450007.1 bifunctional nuclease family protein [Anaerolineae bacterium]
MVEVKVDAVRVNLMGSHRVVILKDLESERFLPIWIGQPEAEAITIHLTNTRVARPLTHDLIVNAIRELGATVRYVVVNDLREETFYARLVLRTRDGKDLSIDSRPSDAIAIAVRVGCSIYVADDIMAQHGQEPEEEASQESDEDLGAFKDFLGTLDLDDLDKK